MDSARPCSTASAALHSRTATGGSDTQTRTQESPPPPARPPRPCVSLPKTYVLARWVVKTYTNCDGGFPETPPPPPPGTSGRRPGGGPWGGPGALLSLRGSWAVWPGPSCGAAMAGSATLQSAREKKDSRCGPKNQLAFLPGDAHCLSAHTRRVICPQDLHVPMMTCPTPIFSQDGQNDDHLERREKTWRHTKVLLSSAPEHSHRGVCVRACVHV